MTFLEYIKNESFWIEVAFLLFVFLGYKPIKKLIYKFLAQARNNVSYKINAAIQKKEEAEHELVTTKDKYSKMIDMNRKKEVTTSKKASNILSQAAARSAVIESQYNDAIKNYQEMHENKIMQDLKSKVLLATTKQVAAKMENDANYEQFLDAAIQNLENASWDEMSA